MFVGVQGVDCVADDEGDEDVGEVAGGVFVVFFGFRGDVGGAVGDGDAGDGARGVNGHVVHFGDLG